MTDRDKARDKLLIEMGEAFNRLCTQFNVPLRSPSPAECSDLQSAYCDLDYEIEKEEEEEERRV